MDIFNTYNELGLGSRLSRLSERLMKEIQLVYNAVDIDFDPYLFPVFKIIVDKGTVTTTQIKDLLQISQPAVTQTINKLSKKSLIEFDNDQKDGRIKLIYLSALGKSRLFSFRTVWGVIEKEVKKLSDKKTNTLIEHLQFFENQLDQKSLSGSIIEAYKALISQQINIIPFESKYAEDFKQLNIAWLKKYFVVEPHDEELLNACEENIINEGGYIFFAKIDGQIAGTFALIKMHDNSYELGKMAVAPKFQGRRIGQKLMEFCISLAKEKKWNKLLLYSNTKLRNAIHIYKKYGFNKVELEKESPYLRSNIKMELILENS